jgi:hypothetical protein
MTWGDDHARFRIGVEKICSEEALNGKLGSSVSDIGHVSRCYSISHGWAGHVAPGPRQCPELYHSGYYGSVPPPEWPGGPALGEGVIT